MPRTSLTQREKIQSSVVEKIQLYRTMTRMRTKAKNDTIAAALGFKESTLYSRLHSPGEMTLDELCTVANVLNISIHTLLGKDDEA